MEKKKNIMKNMRGYPVLSSFLRLFFFGFPLSDAAIRLIITHGGDMDGGRFDDTVRPRLLMRQDALLRPSRGDTRADVRGELCPVVHFELRCGGCCRRLGRVPAVGIPDVPLVPGAVGLGRSCRRPVEQGADQRLEARDAGCYNGCADLDGCPRGEKVRGEDDEGGRRWEACHTRWSDQSCQTRSRRAFRSWKGR